MAEAKTYDGERIAVLSNEWMRRFIETPAEFSHQWQTVGNFLKDEAEGREPSYGEHCAAYLATLDTELTERTSLGV